MAGMKGLVVMAAMMLVGTTLAIDCDVLEDRPMTKVSYGEPAAGFETLGFDDSAWTMGYFPMGSCPTCPELEQFRPLFNFPANSVLTTRTEIVLASEPWNGHVDVRAGDKAWVYVNGVKLGDIHNGGCTADLEGFPVVRMDIPAGVLTAGRNVVVVKGMSTTDAAFLDINVLAETDVCEGFTSVTCPVIGDKKTNVLYVTAENPRPDTWGEIELDESNFVMGMFPLASAGYPCNELGCNPIGGDFPLNSDLVTRNTFFLTKIPASAKARVIVDNSAWVKVNNVHIGDVHFKSCGESSAGRVFDIDVAILREGVNVFAVTGRDTGGAAYLDVEIFVTDAECVVGEVPTPTPAPCTNVYSRSRCNRLRDEGKCDKVFVLNNCQKVCNPDCAPEATPKPEEPEVPACTNVFTTGRCRTLKQDGKCGRPFILRNCLETCDPECSDKEPTGPCENTLSIARCRELKAEGKCGRAYAQEKCAKTCDPECRAAPEPCTNIYTNTRCRTMKKEGKCKLAFVLEKCQRTCNPECAPPPPCTNVYSNKRCETLKDNGKCTNATVLAKCQKTCNPDCFDACDGKCRPKEACIVKTDVPYCVACSTFVRMKRGEKEHCCKVNPTKSGCMAVPSLTKVCERDDNIKLHLEDLQTATFKKEAGEFCGTFNDYKRNGAVFKANE